MLRKRYLNILTYGKKIDASIINYDKKRGFDCR